MEQLFDEHEAAKRLNLRTWTLQNWRHLRKGPPYLKIGGLVRYRESDLDAFLRKRLIDPESSLKRF
jgi:hypothetical protein